MEEATNARGAEQERETRTAMAWGTQEIGAEMLHGDARAKTGKTGKFPSGAANEAGMRGCHGARQAQRGRQGIRPENRDASGVDHKSPGVGDEEGGCKASGVVEKSQGSRQGVGGGVKSAQGNDTPVVTELSQRDKTPRVTTPGASKPR